MVYFLENILYLINIWVIFEYNWVRGCISGYLEAPRGTWRNLGVPGGTLEYLEEPEGTLRNRVGGVI